MASRLWLAGIGTVGLLFCLALVYDRWIVGRTGRALLEDHAQALARRRAQLVRIDDYGVEIDKAWRREIGHFFERDILPRLGPVQQRIALGRRERIEERIDARARAPADPSRPRGAHRGAHPRAAPPPAAPVRPAGACFGRQGHRLRAPMPA